MIRIQKASWYKSCQLLFWAIVLLNILTTARAKTLEECRASCKNKLDYEAGCIAFLTEAECESIAERVSWREQVEPFDSEKQPAEDNGENSEGPSAREARPALQWQQQQQRGGGGGKLRPPPRERVRPPAPAPGSGTAPPAPEQGGGGVLRERPVAEARRPGEEGDVPPEGEEEIEQALQMEKDKVDEEIISDIIFPQPSSGIDVCAEEKQYPLDMQGQWLEQFCTDHRYVPHVSLDKPVYRHGDYIFARAPLFHAVSNTPYLEDYNWIEDKTFTDSWGYPLPYTQTKYYFRVYVTGPNGEEYAVQDYADTSYGTAVSFLIEGDMPEGRYSITFEETSNLLPPGKRKFDIYNTRVPQLALNLEILGQNYGYGEAVEYILSATMPDSSLIPGNTDITCSLYVDGALADADEKKNVNSFLSALRLPKTWDKGISSVTCLVKVEGGIVESMTRSVSLRKDDDDSVVVQFYPESGDLVVGLNTCVYAEVKDSKGDPIDVQGSICSVPSSINIGSIEEEECVATFITAVEGMGKSSRFTPKAGVTYELRIEDPTNIKTVFTLPKALQYGAGLILDEVDSIEGKISFIIGSSFTGKFNLALYKKEKQIGYASEYITNVNEMATKVIFFPKGYYGVLRVTLSNEKGTPLAERLVYFRPPERLVINVAPKDYYSPGEKVELDLEVVDQNGNPVPDCYLGITVTDQLTLEKVDSRDRHPNLIHMVLLENEVYKLENPFVYISEDQDETNKLFEESFIDALLGCQGWRRFVYSMVADFYGQSFLVEDGKGNPLEVPLEKRQQLLGVGEVERIYYPMPMYYRASAMESGEMMMMDMDIDMAFAESAPAMEAAFDFEDDLMMPLAMPVMIPCWAGCWDPIVVPVEEVWTGQKEYAFSKKETVDQAAQRDDFTETNYFCGARKTDSLGKLQVSFQLSDSITTKVLSVDAYNKGGILGYRTSELSVTQQFSISLRTREQVSSGDKLILPVTLLWKDSEENIRNRAEDVEITLAIDETCPLMAKEELSSDDQFSKLFQHAVSLQHDMQTIYFELDFTHPDSLNDQGYQSCQIVIKAKVTESGLADTFVHNFKIYPYGYPEKVYNGGSISVAQPQSTNESPNKVLEFTMPGHAVEGSASVSVKLYPSSYSRLSQAFSSLIRQPYGCFEQYAATYYPLILAIQYFNHHPEDTDPVLKKEAYDLVLEGHTKMQTFSCLADCGIEWFGGCPGHEALTAYGVLLFIEMSKVISINEEYLDCILGFLGERKDGAGGFLRNEKALDTFGRAPVLVTDCYILFCLIKAGITGFEYEVEVLKEKTKTLTDTYTLALAAATFCSIDNSDNILYGKELAKRIVDQQNHDEGFVDGAETSITSSWGESLKTETTGAAAIAWLSCSYSDFLEPIEAAIGWLAQMCMDGKYGSTQSTILALKAILLYEEQRGQQLVNMGAYLFLNGEQISELNIPNKQMGVVEFDIPDDLNLEIEKEYLLAVKIAKTEESQNSVQLPFSAMASWNSNKWESDQDCPISIHADTSDRELEEGSATLLCVDIGNESPTMSTGMVVAIIGIPACMEVHTNRLEELKEQGVFDFFEIHGNDAVFYWRQMQSKFFESFCFEVTAVVAGTCTGQLSQAYVYYNDEHRAWGKDPISVIVSR